MTYSARLYGVPVLSAVGRVTPADFVVEELDAFDAHGEGEHALLTIRKVGLTTADVLRKLSTWAAVPTSAIGYAGLKDKHGITTQRFTVQMPGRDTPATDSLHNGEHLQVIKVERHHRKLPRGASLGNAFELTLRSVSGDRDAIEHRLRQIAVSGFANAFGSQRFGRSDNVQNALSMFRGKRVNREMRGLLLSAARAAIFNAQLSMRVATQRILQVTDGDILMLTGTRSIFGPVSADEALQRRLLENDLSVTAPLWGQGDPRTSGEILQMELDVVRNDVLLQELARGLRRHGLQQERRAAIAVPEDLQWQWPESDVLTLRFSLGPGSYATSLLHELGEVRDASLDRS